MFTKNSPCSPYQQNLIKNLTPLNIKHANIFLFAYYIIQYLIVLIKMSYFIIFEKTFISNKYTCASYMTLEHFLKLLQWSNKLWDEITTVHIIKTYTIYLM